MGLPSTPILFCAHRAGAQKTNTQSANWSFILKILRLLGVRIIKNIEGVLLNFSAGQDLKPGTDIAVKREQVVGSAISQPLVNFHGGKELRAVYVQGHNQEVTGGIFLDRPLAPEAAAHHFTKVSAPYTRQLINAVFNAVGNGMFSHVIGLRIGGGFGGALHPILQLRQQVFHLFQALLAVIEFNVELARHADGIFRVILHHSANILCRWHGLIVAAARGYSSSSTSSPRAALAAVTIFS